MKKGVTYWIYICIVGVALGVIVLNWLIGRDKAEANRAKTEPARTAKAAKKAERKNELELNDDGDQEETSDDQADEVHH